MAINFSFSGGTVFNNSGKLYTDTGEVGDGISPLRPLHATEIYKKLKSRDWNIYPRKYVVSGELYLAVNPSVAPELVINNIEGIKQSHQVNYTEDWIQRFQNEYKNDLEQMKKAGETYIYDSSKKSIDLLKSSVFINVIREDSNLYTSYADLGDILVTGFDGKLDFSVRYAKDEKTYDYSATLKASPDYTTSTGNSDVEIEYKNGVLSAYPKKKEVNECIINSLQLTYGLL